VERTVISAWAAAAARLKDTPAKNAVFFDMTP